MKKINPKKPGRKILSKFFAWAVFLFLSVPIFVSALLPPPPPFPPSGPPDEGGGGWDPDTLSNTVGLPEGSIYNIIYYLMLWILGIFGFIGIIGFVISGIMYLTAAGNEEQIKKAKRAMMFSIIGVLVGLVGLVVIFAVDTMLGGDNVSY